MSSPAAEDRARRAAVSGAASSPAADATPRAREDAQLDARDESRRDESRRDESRRDESRRDDRRADDGPSGSRDDARRGTTAALEHAARPTAALVALSFALLYVVWGTTYVAIRFALESYTPLLIGALRFTIAGALLLAWCAWRGQPWPRLAHWRFGFVVGGLLCALSNGLVVWAEQRVASGLAALMVATVPLWMWIGEVATERRASGGARLYFGLALGSLGVVALAGPGLESLGGAIDPWGALALFVSPLTWTVGSLLSRRMAQPQSSLQASALQMLCGGCLLVAASLAWETPLDTLAAGPALGASACVVYLCLFGSLVCLSAYGWLLRHVSPTRVATYAYVNPVVALAVGAWFADEPFGWRAALASALILSAVVLVLARPRRAD